MKTLPAKHYQVGWICAVRPEFVVASRLLDEKFTSPDLLTNDNNIYTCGRMGEHNVVITCLALGNYGLTSAASAAMDMLCSFQAIRFGLMVGTGGGAPTKEKDIRLSDVVVSAPVSRSGGVIPYAFGKTIQNRAFEWTGSLNSPPKALLGAVGKLAALHEINGHQIRSTVDDMIQKNPRLQRRYQKPPPQTDVLYKSSFTHPNDNEDCMELCIKQRDQIVQRPDRDPNEDDPVVHYGLIASADQLMKDADARDRLAEKEGVLCFEMEAAGLMDRFPCVVIRGICDYSDTHKNDIWQGYAAAIAAAYAKELLGVIPGNRFLQEVMPTAAYTMENSSKKCLEPAKLEAMLKDRPHGKGQDLYWQTSIVDLLKLLCLDSGLQARGWLADILNVHVDLHGRAKQNIALHRALMKALAENNGRVPKDIQDSLSLD